jgi:hypothetical protein
MQERAAAKQRERQEHRGAPPGGTSLPLDATGGGGGSSGAGRGGPLQAMAAAAGAWGGGSGGGLGLLSGPSPPLPVEPPPQPLMAGGLRGSWGDPPWGGGQLGGLVPQALVQQQPPGAFPYADPGPHHGGPWGAAAGYGGGGGSSLGSALAGPGLANAMAQHYQQQWVQLQGGAGGGSPFAPGPPRAPPPQAFLPGAPAPFAAQPPFPAPPHAAEGTDAYAFSGGGAGEAPATWPHAPPLQKQQPPPWQGSGGNSGGGSGGGGGAPWAPQPAEAVAAEQQARRVKEQAGKDVYR